MSTSEREIGPTQLLLGEFKIIFYTNLFNYPQVLYHSFAFQLPFQDRSLVATSNLTINSSCIVECHKLLGKIIILSSELSSSVDLKVTIMLIFRDPTGYSLGRSKHYIIVTVESVTNTGSSGDLKVTMMLIFRDLTGYSLGRSKLI